MLPLSLLWNGQYERNDVFFNIEILKRNFEQLFKKSKYNTDASHLTNIGKWDCQWGDWRLLSCLSWFKIQDTLLLLYTYNEISFVTIRSAARKTLKKTKTNWLEARGYFSLDNIFIFCVYGRTGFVWLSLIFLSLSSKTSIHVRQHHYDGAVPLLSTRPATVSFKGSQHFQVEFPNASVSLKMRMSPLICFFISAHSFNRIDNGTFFTWKNWQRNMTALHTPDILSVRFMRSSPGTGLVNRCALSRVNMWIFFLLNVFLSKLG